MHKLLAIIAGVLLVWGAACLILYFAMTGAAAAEPVFRGADGLAHSHDEQWDGIWIAQEFGRCCGKQDCFRIPEGGVVRVDGGYLVVETGEVFRHLDPQIEPSKDGTFWRCVYQRGARAGQTRCLFIPPLGF